MLGRLNHVAIAVKDAEKAAKIYSGAFGAEISAAVPLPEHGVITVFVTLPNTKIEFIQPLGESSPIAKFLERNADGGIHHVCYDVPDISRARYPDQGGRARARRRHTEDRRTRQAGAVPASEGFFRRACRNRASLSHGLHYLSGARDLLRVVVDRAVLDAAIRRPASPKTAAGSRHRSRRADRTRMGRKLIWTTVISTLIFAAAMAAYHAGLLNIEQLSKLLGVPI